VNEILDERHKSWDRLGDLGVDFLDFFSALCACVKDSIERGDLKTPVVGS
jgi:hypothetical protein